MQGGSADPDGQGRLQALGRAVGYGPSWAPHIIPWEGRPWCRLSSILDLHNSPCRETGLFFGGGRLKGDAGVGGSRPVCDECVNFRAPGLSQGQLLPWALQGLSMGLAQAQLWASTRTATCPQGGAWGLSGRGEGLRVTLVTHHWYIPGGAGQTRPGLPWAAGTGEGLESSDTSQDGKEEILPVPISCLLDYFGAWRERDIILQS